MLLLVVLRYRVIEYVVVYRLYVIMVTLCCDFKGKGKVALEIFSR